MMRTMNPITLFRLMLCLASLSSATAAEMSVAEAWEVLNRPTFWLIQRHPARPTPEEEEAHGVLRRNPAASKQLLFEALRKGGNRRNAIGLMGSVGLNREQEMHLAREVADTYPTLDKSMPFTGTFAMSGEPDDIKKYIIPRIAADPDSDSAADLAALMATRGNEHAHAALLDLKDKVPGKWQESFNVRKFFDSVAQSTGTPERGTAQVDGGISRGRSADPARHEPESPSGAAPGTSRIDESRLWVWIACGIVLLVVVFVAAGGKIGSGR